MLTDRRWPHAFRPRDNGVMALPTCLLALFTGLPCLASAQEDARPSILLLLADDMRQDLVSAWGNSSIETPALDALARQGMSFKNAHCLGSPHGAVCQPSRAMLHTGRAYIGRDIENLRGQDTLGELLGAAGYQTFATGKWHQTKAAFARSFESGRCIFFGGMSDHRAIPLVDFLGGEFVHERVGEGHSTDLIAEAAIEFLEGPLGEAPFFCSVAFTAVHDPRDPPSQDLPRYRTSPPPLPGNFMGQHPFDCGWLRVRDENLAPWPRTEAVVRAQLAEYYALATHMDRRIADILAALDRSGRRANTLVIFAADHGLALGSHGLLGKQSLYEHSSGLPLIVVGKRSCR